MAQFKIMKSSFIVAACFVRSPFSRNSWQQFLDESPTRPPSIAVSPYNPTRKLEQISYPTSGKFEEVCENLLERFNKIAQPQLHSRIIHPTLNQIRNAEKLYGLNSLIIINDISDLFEQIDKLYQFKSCFTVITFCSINNVFKDQQKFTIDYKSIMLLPICTVNSNYYNDLCKMGKILNCITEGNINLYQQIDSILQILQGDTSPYLSIIRDSVIRFIKSDIDISKSLYVLVKELVYKIVRTKLILADI